MEWNKGNAVYTLGQIKTLWDQGLLKINREYQRGFVWSERFQKDLIISLFNGYPIGSIIVRPAINNDNILEIVDGQQRLQTIINFIYPSSEKERLFLNSTHGLLAKKILKNSKNINSFDDIDELLKIKITSQLSIPFQFIKGTDNEIKEYFNMIQQQEAVKAGEIISNLPFEIFENFKNHFEKIEKILKNIGFNNKREDFIKILISNCGIKNGIFFLGSTDDETIKFSKDLTYKFNIGECYKKLSKEKFEKDIEHSFNFLNRMKENLDIGKGKRRFIRLTLLITNDLDENSYIDFEFLATINRKISELNNKETLFEENKKNEFITKLIDDKIINNNEEFKEFIKLADLFSKTKNITQEHKNTINFWRNKIIKSK